MPEPSAPSSPEHVDHHEVACPFCGLLCDDLTVRAHAGTLDAVENACRKARDAYTGAVVHDTPTLDGTATTLPNALKHAARFLKRSRQPLFAGLGTDVNGMRAVLALAERCRGTIDHMHSTALGHNMRVLQARGWQTTTLSEVRNRADLVVLVGVDVNVNYQNLLSRHLAPAAALQPARRASRQLVYLGGRAKAPAQCHGLPCDVIPCDDSALTSSVRALAALVGGRTVTLGGRELRSLTRLAEQVKAAQYPVFLWAPGQLPSDHGDLTIAAICDLIADLNRTQRAAGLALGGDDGGQTALAAAAWTTGFPLGVSFAGTRLSYTPGTSNTAHALREGGADLLVWISAFARRPPPDSALPQIVLAPPGLNCDRADSVYIPVGTPGLDHAGQLIRTDGVVALPLRALRNTGLPSVAEVVQRLAMALE